MFQEAQYRCKRLEKKLNVKNMENEKEYIVKDYEKGIYSILQSTNSPTNYVLDYPEYNNIYGRKYMIVKHDISVFWTNGTYQGNYLTFSKDKMVLLKVNRPTIQTVCEYLNKFENITEEELEKYLEKAKVNAEK
jgi:hypothetical protein